MKIPCGGCLFAKKCFSPECFWPLIHIINKGRNPIPGIETRRVSVFLLHAFSKNTGAGAALNILYAEHATIHQNFVNSEI
jgi:hypothetical protein